MNLSWYDFVKRAARSRPVNPKIASYMTALGRVEREGDGGRAIRAFLKKHGDDTIYCNQEEGGVRVAVLLPWARALGESFKNRSDAENRAEIHGKSLLEGYLNALANRLKSYSFDILYPNFQKFSNQHLETIFVPLHVSSRNRTANNEVLLADTDHANENKLMSALSFVSKNPYSTLIGQPGSGKTTFANELAGCLANEILGVEKEGLQRLGSDWTEGSLLPVRIAVRNIDFNDSDDKFGWENQLWAQFVKSLNGPDPVALGTALRRTLVEDGGMIIIDGFDEGRELDGSRDWITKAIVEFRNLFPKARILLTSRIYAYHGISSVEMSNFEVAVLAPFSEAQKSRFVTTWFESMVKGSVLQRGAAERQGLSFQEVITQNTTLREISSNPLLLTLLAVLYSYGSGQLPRGRDQIFGEVVALLLDRWETAKGVTGLDESNAPFQFIARDRLLVALEQLAFNSIRAEASTLKDTAEISQGDLISALMKVSDKRENPALLLEFIRDRTGILSEVSPGLYRFPHRTIQEYLAACHLAKNDFPEALCELVGDDPIRWQDIFLLAGLKTARGTRFGAWGLIDRILDFRESAEPSAMEGSSLKKDQYLVLLAARLLTEAKLDEMAADLESSSAERMIRSRIVNGLLEIFVNNDPTATSIDRLKAGEALGNLGDPRTGVSVDENGLPDIAWREIEPGEFRFGKKSECREIEESFWISKYTVTVSQYQAFVDDGGYLDSGWWKFGGFGLFESPEDYAEIFQIPNHPRVGISWFEAWAFCSWFTSKRGGLVGLPTEIEWERAARHLDGRVFPWGDASTQIMERCNSVESGIGHTSAVGTFPLGDAVCGAADMSGNVWEWTNQNDGHEDYRVGKGGAFIETLDLVKCDYRSVSPIKSRDRSIGFRVVLTKYDNE